MLRAETAFLRSGKVRDLYRLADGRIVLVADPTPQTLLAAIVEQRIALQVLAAPGGPALCRVPAAVSVPGQSFLPDGVRPVEDVLEQRALGAHQSHRAKL